MYFQINDANYWYDVHGNQSKQPLVLFHGFTSSTATWSRFISSWQRKYYMITVDLPGHGKTKTPSPRTMEECCADLAKLFHHLQLTEFHLIGYSMGGRTALSFALLYPDVVKSLILESASPGLATEAERVIRIKHDEQLATRIETEGIVNFVNFWESIPLFATQKGLPEHVRLTIREERLSQSEEGLAQSLRYMGTGRQPSWWDHLHEWKKPVLLLVGEKDKKFININRKMYQCFSTSEMKIVEEAGHTIHVEQPEKFGNIVSKFIFSNKL